MNLRENKQVPKLFKIQCLRRADRATLGLPQRDPIAQVRKPVSPGFGRPVHSKVLPARVLHCLHEVEDGSAVDGDDGTVEGATLIPTAAVSCPDCSFEILLDVLVIFLVGVVVDLEAADAFGLDFVNPFIDIRSRCLDPEDQ